jgi:hypothetical protein
VASFVQTKTQTNNNQIEKIFNQWQSDAVIIYDNFISLQAKSSLGFDLLIRQQVETNICLNIIDHLDIEYLVNSYSNVFYLPMLVVFNILEKVYFKRFLVSSLYKKYINEIKLNSQLNSSKLNENKQNKKETPVNLNKIGTNNNNDLWSRPKNVSNMKFGNILYIIFLIFNY